MLLKRRTCGPVLRVRGTELAAQLADEGALQPQQVVQAEEAEHAEQQAGHAQPDQVDVEIAFRVRRVGVRVEGQERRIDVRVAGAAGLGQVGRVDARARVGCRQVVVRRVAVGAGRGLGVVQRRRLAVEAVAGTRRSPCRGNCRSRSATWWRVAAAVSGRLIACGSWQVEHTGASVDFLPPLAAFHNAPWALSCHSRRMPLVAACRRWSGMLAWLVGGRRLGLGMDIVLAVAARAGRRGLRQAHLQQRARMFAALVVRHHVFVAAAAGLDLVDRRQRRRRVAAACSTRCRLSWQPLQSLMALSPAARRPWMLPAMALNSSAWQSWQTCGLTAPSGLAGCLMVSAASWQVGAVELAVRRAGELVGQHGDRLAVFGLHLRVVVAAEALFLQRRMVEAAAGRRRGRGGLGWRGQRQTAPATRPTSQRLRTGGSSSRHAAIDLDSMRLITMTPSIGLSAPAASAIRPVRSGA